MSSLSREEEKILAGCSGRVKAAKWYESEKQSRQRLEADMWKREREKKVAQVAEKMAAAEAREKEFAAMKEKTARAESAQKKIRDRVLGAKKKQDFGSPLRVPRLMQGFIEPVKDSPLYSTPQKMSPSFDNSNGYVSSVSVSSTSSASSPESSEKRNNDIEIKLRAYERLILIINFNSLS